VTYPEEELEDALRRAFTEGKADYIFIDNRYARFLIASASFGVQKGWLDEEFVEVDEQYSQIRCWLTEAGKKHFGLA
jgi:hypothetical protein